MQQNSGKRLRRREVAAGLIIILVVFSYITSLLLDFNFVSPYASLQEDLAYFSDHIQNQRISSWSWLGTGLITFSAVPFFLLALHKRLRRLHYINAIFILGASAGFVLMGIKGLGLHQNMVQELSVGLLQADEQVKYTLLDQFKEEQLFRRMGSTAVGLFAIGLSFFRFRLERFPIFSTILLLLSGPTLIFFNWYDPDHLIRTGAMAGIMIGVAVFCVRLINKGLTN